MQRSKSSKLNRNFDIVVINSPLLDETGEAFSRQISSTAQVILIVKEEFYEAITTVCEPHGVFVISKPVNKVLFHAVLSFAKSAHSKLIYMQSENLKLKNSIEEIKITDRAKCLLISHQGMTEQQAHRHIEKQAMNKRSTKKIISYDIIKAYENEE